MTYSNPREIVTPDYVALAQIWAHATDEHLAAIASGSGEEAASARAEQQRRADCSTRWNASRYEVL